MSDIGTRLIGIRIGEKGKKVFVDLGNEFSWLAFTPEEAHLFADKIKEVAESISLRGHLHVVDETPDVLQ